MEIKQLLTPYNYTKPNNLKQNKFIVVHYTANNGDTAKGNCKYFAKKLNDNKKASAHYFVDEKEIWQCVDDSNIAWHIGGAKVYYNHARNSNSIGVELCSRKSSDGYYFKNETIRNAQKLIAYLMTKYNIKTENVVRHFDCTRKNCPAPFVENQNAWIQFVNELKWVDSVIDLKTVGRLNEAEEWVLKQFEEDEKLKYIFMKWADDIDKKPKK